MDDALHSLATIFDLLRAEEVGTRLLEFTNRQTLFRPNEPATDLYLVESGEIRLFAVGLDDRERLHDILGSSELFGFSALVMLATYGKLAVSVDHSTVRAASAERLRNALTTRGDLAVQLVEVLSLQVHNVWTDGSNLISDDCQSRLIRKLIVFAKSPAATPIAGGVELHISHAELAQAIGTARETVSICLMRLRKENLVTTGRNRVIYDPDRLTQLCPDTLSAVLETAVDFPKTDPDKFRASFDSLYCAA